MARVRVFPEGALSEQIPQEKQYRYMRQHFCDSQSLDDYVSVGQVGLGEEQRPIPGGEDRLEQQVSQLHLPQSDA